MAGGAHPGRPRVRLRVSRAATSSGLGDPLAPPRRLRNRMPRLRPLMRRALRLARHVEHLSSDVTDAHAAQWVPRLDQRVAVARAPKRLAAITRLARIPAPVRVSDAVAPAARVAAQVPAPAAGPVAARARAVSVARDFAPPLPSAVDVGGADLVESASENDPLVAGPTSTGAKASVSEGFSPRQRVDRSSGSFSALPESSSSSSEPGATQAPGAPRLLRAPPEPPPPDLPDDMKFLWDVWQREKPGGRGVLERGRGAKIVEGSASQGEAPAADAPQVSRVPAESPPVSEPPVPAFNEPGAPADIDTREATAEAPSLRRLARQPATGPSPEPRQPTSPPPARPGAMRMARKPSEAADDPAGVSPPAGTGPPPAATEPPPDAPVVDEQRPSPPEERRRHARASTCRERFGRADGSAPRCDATRAQQSSRATGTRSQPTPERLGISRDGVDQRSGRPAAGVVGAPRSRRRHASAGPGAATRARDDRVRARRPACRRTQPRACPRRRGAHDRRPDRSRTG